MGCKINKEWLAMEAEHTSSKARQRIIAGQHIKEFGCGYYPALKKMELSLKK